MQAGITDESSHYERNSESADLLSVLWRYRWIGVLTSLLGGVIGFAVFWHTPVTYRCSIRFLIEPDRPGVLDVVTRDHLGISTTFETVQSQLFSDSVGKMAFETEFIERFHSRFQNDPIAFVKYAQNAMRMEAGIASVSVGQPLVALIHVDDQDPEFCEAAVKGYYLALRSFFDEQQKSSRGDLIQLINVATEKLHPKMLELEQQYRTFRIEAPLAWTSDGEAINPHRERQLQLMKRRSELLERQRELDVEIVSIRSVVQRTSHDPLLALWIVGQLLDKNLTLPSELGYQANLREADNQLKQLEIDQELIPLTIERDKYEAQFGPNHPTVLALDLELSTKKKELKRLVEEQTSRMAQLLEQEKPTVVDPIGRAKQALEAVMFATMSQSQLLGSQIEQLDLQIIDERDKAIKLAQVEQENESLLREIDRTRELMNQLDEQMARVSLTEEDSGTKVVELTAPSSAHRVGPDFWRMVGVGLVGGFALGAGISLLLERNSKTFRDADEISQVLGVPVLGHVPTFEGWKPGRRGRDYAFQHLDPFMAAVHMPYSVAAEAIRTCRTSVLFDAAACEGNVIQVTSPLPGDGKSTMAGNLACSIAQSGKRVLVIDCDLRRPQLSSNFALDNAVGLSNVLNSDCEPMEAIHSTPIEDLFVMPSGPIPANPAEALLMPQTGELLGMLREKFDYVLIDTPPLLVVTDPSIIACLVDGVVMTLRVRRKSRSNAKEALKILNTVGARVFGVIVNNSDNSLASDGYRGAGYYRYRRYTSRYQYRDESMATGAERTPAFQISRHVQ